MSVKEVLIRREVDFEIVNSDDFVLLVGRQMLDPMSNLKIEINVMGHTFKNKDGAKPVLFSIIGNTELVDDWFLKLEQIIHIYRIIPFGKYDIWEVKLLQT